MKKIVYFIEFDGAYVYLGTNFSDVEAHLKENLESDDDEQFIKAKYMTQQEIDDLPEADL